VPIRLNLDFREELPASTPFSLSVIWIGSATRCRGRCSA
jgi:hypothetical protein